PLRSANCGFDARWSEPFRTRYAGEPVKNVVIEIAGGSGEATRRRGEFGVPANGVEGGLIYACSARLRGAIEWSGEVTMHVDLAPDRSTRRLTNEMTRSRGSNSWSRHLEHTVGLRGVKIGLL